ncbi:bifunctional [glutamate--ammonia ligase]-adenylyl-L-tyrosine phosphorylase/[glutamate--ammonia-ligase] adenylyltransferase [Methyloversatilis sp.]|uniref:bifunctional [glutamate--ammonia ligase]-adenylyl-L-tyrosine phosphorylase/[glutamate--ammonia-ligase] adenylyltransferase n=2 Tax=Methyloversatilis sp. TaxID=2569862 RepID=UPI00273640F3|nr:bifunctional [glutamate--ammonia ligase]-adenylyl-L-tyrosine phosphorylase/[glutamate--ammonia-ligase] adenylyltransferase [Methyloversatilis sp.]MDP3287729.1 bifunctional [glutamate--ammonia ligase]-adenylyl-L-tyrosine phosphorylase/[glutamate--ammonia-ligase] adenylyltransferase [Methyloversatilis sp.]MDP3454066.1 bifunctional [glutamate--ammonia ligase]-adenylyl-L-tyrosine phosphorylase/[glutamate--ammonia-ligase] adenylyltransferase [Methyloversatilis sp.]MDP3578232.1 bifunctional [glutam
MDASTAIAHARRHSRYLDRLLDARPALIGTLTGTLQAHASATVLEDWLAQTAFETGDEAGIKRALRHLRARTMAHLIVRDLAGLADLDEVTEGMTLLAELTVRVAADQARLPLTARFGEPRGEAEDGSAGVVQPFICIGMGKLGGRELNVSSDVDFIFVYPESGETDGQTPNGLGKQIDNFDFFTRLSRKVIELLSEVTADGFVFRVDMRLRPNGDSGPLAVSFDMLENYFFTQGREWERYAWIKARALTGSRHDELESLRKPFVFRKYLDFGAINAMRDLHAQIRREVARRDMADNVKLGPGGIREIEFIAQVFQLIRGGRESALQIRPTQKVLDRLAMRGVMTEEAVDELHAAYVFLRRLEHRLQYLDDAQTHKLPADSGDQALIASAMGFDDYASLLSELDAHRSRVSRHFDAVFGAQETDTSAPRALWQDADQGDDCRSALATMGFSEPEDLSNRLVAFKSGSRYRQLPDTSRNRVDALVPKLLEACRETPHPTATALRGLDLLEAISRRAAYLALLAEFPQALGQVARLIGASSWAASYLVRHPILLDELLDARLLTGEPDWPAFDAALRVQLDELGDDTERQMDTMRDAHHAQVFRLLARDLAGELSVERLSDHLSALADVMLRVTLDLCWRKLARRHRDTPRFAVISYGKLGGKELGYASDLDVIFLFDDEHESAPEIYARLAQRLLTWLSSHTSAGMLFETDTRLRPNGESGLLVSSVEAFRDYQRKSAWVWEHQALTRARFSAGDAQVGEQFEAIRNEVLTRDRDLTTLQREVLDMRRKMREGHANKSDLFDIKHDPGGLIDLEFAVQYLVLAYASRHPELTGNLGNITLLRIASQFGLLPAPDAVAAGNAYRHLRHLQHGLRLNDAPKARVDPAQVVVERAAITAIWTRLFPDAANLTTPS